VKDSDRTLREDFQAPSLTGTRKAVITVLQGTVIGQLTPLTSIRTVIGRGKDVDIPLADQKASREHCAILRVWDAGDGNFLLRDLSSTNGSFVNGVRAMPELPLKEGDRIKVGNHLFRFSMMDDLEIEAARSLMDSPARSAGSDYILRFDLFHLPSGVDLLYRDEQVVALEPQAVRVLRYLVEHSDRVISKDELLEAVWPEVFTTDGVLKKAVSQIRRALGDDSRDSRFIETYHRRGYRFVAPVERQLR
jgi:DNA-binding winged helix-turn-helix (wHTH) protein